MEHVIHASPNLNAEIAEIARQWGQPAYVVLDCVNVLLYEVDDPATVIVGDGTGLTGAARRYLLDRTGASPSAFGL